MMPNPRTPAHVARTTGADLRNPARYKDRSDPVVGEVGEPYDDMSEDEQTIWRQVVSEIPWLASSDRMQLRILCELADENYTKGLTVSKLNLMRQILNSFGGSPSDRTKVLGLAPEKEDPDDPTAEFLN